MEHQKEQQLKLLDALHVLQESIALVVLMNL